MGIRPFVRSSLAWAAIAALSVSGSGRLSAAQSVNERDATVAYLYNFAKFVEWPADTLPAHAPLTICVMGDGSLGADLEDAVRGREIAGHKVTVARVKADHSLRPCQLLYATGLDQKTVDQLIATTAGIPVFTVSDIARFAERGGVASLLFDGGRMRFAINVSTAQRAHLTISSRLLALATIVKDDIRTRD